MSDSHAVFFGRIILDEELARFVVAEGGQWQDWEENPCFRQGVFVDEDVIVFVRGVDNQQADLRFFTPEETREADLRFGGTTASVLTVDHTKGAKGERLAERVIRKMIDMWEGVELSCD